MDYSEQSDRWLEQWCVEPGLFRRCRGSGAVFSRSVFMRWALHDTSEQPRYTRSALSLHRFQRKLQRLRALGAIQFGRDNLGERADSRHFDPNLEVLRCAAHELRRANQRSAARGQGPHPDSGYLQSESDTAAHASGYGGSWHRLPDIDSREWNCLDDRAALKRGDGFRDNLRRWHSELTVAAAIRYSVLGQLC